MDNFKPLSGGYGIQPIDKSPTGKGDIHDTFGINKEGDIFGGHTTVQIPGCEPKRMPWDPK